MQLQPRLDTMVELAMVTYFRLPNAFKAVTPCMSNTSCVRSRKMCFLHSSPGADGHLLLIVESHWLLICLRPAAIREQSSSPRSVTNCVYTMTETCHQLGCNDDATTDSTCFETLLKSRFSCKSLAFEQTPGQLFKRSGLLKIWMILPSQSNPFEARLMTDGRVL